ncbi:MAG: hypothetical protein Q7S73_00445 [bacterium]|nr:hypothetical protein [bacterium]
MSDGQLPIKGIKSPSEKDKEIFPLLEEALRSDSKPKLPISDNADPAKIVEEKWGNLNAKEIARIKPKE